jgi:hypothetical protein
VEDVLNLLKEAQARVQLLGENLPVIVDPASISLSAKIPYKALCFREGLIWRAEELGRTACEHYAGGDYVAAIVLTRALAETAAAAWYLKDLIERQLSSGVEMDLDDQMMRLLMGHKNLADMPQAINVLTFLDRVDKLVPGIRKSYDTLSEYSHPNWHGTALAYSENDRERILTNFGRGYRDPSRHASLGLNCLIGSLMIFETAYNAISTLFPNFVKACEADLSK